MLIVRATSQHLQPLSRLFNKYLRFYKKDSTTSVQQSQKYLACRLQAKDSVAFLAYPGSSDESKSQDEPVGFMQLYPSYTSLGMKRNWVLNDLFIDEGHRRRGIASKLIERAIQFAEEDIEPADEITLETQVSNREAQALYEKYKFERIAVRDDFLTMRRILEPLRKEFAQGVSSTGRALYGTGVGSSTTMGVFAKAGGAKRMKNTVLITGVTKGMGLAMASEFLKIGDWRIIGCGRTEKDIIRLRAEFGANHRFDVIDVVNETQVSQWASQVCAESTPDLLINNASIVNDPAPFTDISSDVFKQVMDINFYGVLNVTRAFFPFMKSIGKASIVNISSGWGREAEENLSPYCSSKFALEGFTSSLSKEAPETFTIVALDPGGAIGTEMLRKCLPDEVEDSPTPEEWAAKAVPYILSLDRNANGKSLTCPNARELSPTSSL